LVARSGDVRCFYSVHPASISTLTVTNIHDAETTGAAGMVTVRRRVFIEAWEWGRGYARIGRRRGVAACEVSP